MRDISSSSPMLLEEAPCVAGGAWVCFGESIDALQAVGAAAVVGSL